MKKILLTFLILIFALSLFLFTPVTASAETLSPYANAQTYASLYPARDILSGGEALAAGYLEGRLTALGYDVTSSKQTYTDDGGTEKKTYDYRHVIGNKDNGKEKTVLIGCYYGGYAVTDGKGEGATNALSVGLLLNLAERLSTLSLDYDLAIAFWGGAEVYDFDLKNCGVKVDRVALYIHLDGVAAGTSDYLYADEISRAHEKYFREIISEEKAEILAPPAFKKPINLSIDDAYAYVHPGLSGINRYFMMEDVPCLDFLGGAWDFDCGLYRYKDERSDIEGTELDILEEIDKRNGGAEKTAARLSAVSDVIVKGLTGENLTSVLDRAAEETSAKDLDSTLAYYLITFIGAAAIIAFFIILIVKQGKDRREEVWESFFRSVGEEEDPFEELRGSGDASSDHDGASEEGGAQDLPSGENGENEDDIFRF